MKFKNNIVFNTAFENIKDIRFYPYVGNHFPSQQKRILVFAHNIYCPPEIFESEQLRKSSKTFHADTLEQNTYQHGLWTRAFRNFIRGSLSISENYTSNSNRDVIDKIDSFVEKISYTNYINDLVSSDNANNINVNSDLVNKSHLINNELIKILDATHIVCWGKNVFNYIISQPEIIISERISNFGEIAGLQNKKGFEYVKIKTESKEIHVLKVFHPSMPSFGVNNKDTHSIMNWFYNL